MTAAAVSVIVPARNAETTLPRALDALARQSFGKPYEVIVVDNGSADRTAEIARDHPIGATVVRNEPGQGPGSARNRGALEATGPVLAFTDSDCYPTADWLEQGLRAMADTDLLQGAVSPDPGASRGPFDRTVSVTGESGFYETANLFVRRSLFDAIGGFEDWVVAGGDGLFGWRAPRDGRAARPAKRPIGEDVLFGWRGRRSGARTSFSSSALVYHEVFEMSRRRGDPGSLDLAPSPGLAESHSGTPVTCVLQAIFLLSPQRRVRPRGGGPRRCMPFEAVDPGARRPALCRVPPARGTLLA